MEHKNIVATIYIKDGMAVKSPTELDDKSDVLELASVYDDSGIDKIICYDLSTDDEEHEKNILAIREINRNIQVKTAGGGNIKRLEDVKKLLYAGCVEVILNGSKPETIDLIKEASARFGAEKMLVSLATVDFLFKTKDFLADNVHELLIMNTGLLEGLENITNIPYIVQVDEYDFDYILGILKSEQIRGISGQFLNSTAFDAMRMKSELSDQGIKMDNFEAKLDWADLKPNSDGLIPTVVQDFQTGEVLMVAYMNEESLNATIRTGKMTYFSRSRQSLWVKGETSGHFQYVKSLTADCDFDTILAKVSQVGVACHTGAPSCFFNEIVKKEYIERNPLKVFEDVYAVIEDRKKNPKEGSYTNYLFDKGLDKILKKVGEEATEIVIAAKNPESEETKYEISDFLYHMMVLMVEKGVTWEDVTSELAQR
ncbi:bifunctional phosphoribosyl-AMP cyclohydrolase/phosphoribosyl-ATP diphosphatase HisIE [Pseudobutyrivibrio sp.]|uniref:bifunctional phosphoribosyl-AMP cyclohydrolase/phosphoribosyl-ATP diphosphatase HisIE n=1 Tax=Pseudobutyrivibrio sp. TaxID=2014367 RepID=UPI001B694AA7|nr:bifunctional phosphoribosyl-AMP cyclohydrolase/phosphoribosyl-ATP diphosphatase HisIE [Pseudobutyrivibrio sp.]MBP5595221.1 bifunctional phosphoribosyl-AMP cyclohydrolase/phosphoribosyl-ATP diphosphatase HisIE [Pseudobutyrivibrio sp.]MBR5649886.1 bifunctional phosphoribosyl-AMP cyclohydrolase/phosphoribosyl-ATP diphosphatase HisIE [Pseudobutyrivibrio sp.]